MFIIRFNSSDCKEWVRKLEFGKQYINFSLVDKFVFIKKINFYGFMGLKVRDKVGEIS